MFGFNKLPQNLPSFKLPPLPQNSSKASSVLIFSNALLLMRQHAVLLLQRDADVVEYGLNYPISLCAEIQPRLIFRKLSLQIV